VPGRVLVLGGGAREHALVQALLRSPAAHAVLCAPGNAGIAAEVEVPAPDLNVQDGDAVVALARAVQADLVVVGPEAPLVAGVSDALKAAGIRCFGPSAAAARLEGSKAFCKDVMQAAGVPTASYTVVSDVEAGMAAVPGYPVVVKADGLAAGKGVFIAPDQSAARAALEELLVARRFGTELVVVEEFLDGEELSLFAICDGERALPLASAQDYKRIFDADQGPNTGGMGSYSPVPSVDEARGREICAAVHQPVLDELARRGSPFHGLLYAGLMMSDDRFNVLEFNVRFGDPETQAILPRLRSDLLELLSSACEPGGLGETRLQWAPEPAVTVVLASAGYPQSSSSGDVISGLESAGASPAGAVYVNHAGTALDAGGRIVTAGGRVLCVTAVAADFTACRRDAYAAAEMIEFDGCQMRHDIALRVAG
jgi:phosphoribosylamine--glycine ligase